MRLPDLLVPAAERPVVESDAALRRRRVTVAVTLVVGTGLLAATLRVPNGSGWFTGLALLVAATWIVGAMLSGPIRIRPPPPAGVRTVALPAVAVGVGAFVVFLVAHVVGRRLPIVSDALDSVLATADAGPMMLILVVALVNGVAEELFFRGAIHAALEPRRPALTSTIVYVAATAATGNVALVAAAVVIGSILSLERLSTRSVLAPMITHVTWSTLVLLVLPR